MVSPRGSFLMTSAATTEPRLCPTTTISEPSGTSPRERSTISCTNARVSLLSRYRLASFTILGIGGIVFTSGRVIRGGDAFARGRSRVSRDAIRATYSVIAGRWHRGMGASRWWELELAPVPWRRAAR